MVYRKAVRAELNSCMRCVNKRPVPYLLFTCVVEWEPLSREVWRRVMFWTHFDAFRGDMLKANNQEW